ncbi:cyclase family protein [Romboutsia sp.]|uniref:cyclase family protein n=1 Tax=Romboutsia sp. TaxID=1965302 RepID=UPI003F29FD17
MKIFDLTHTLTNDMPVYSKPNGPHIKKVATIEANGYEETFLSMFSHNGTHIDSTKHMDKNGETLDDLDIDKFVGNAILIDVTNKEKIELEYLKEYEEKIQNCDFIIFKSGWSEYWGEEKYYEKYPTLTIQAATYIAQTPIKGIGMDMLSVDGYDSVDFNIHKILFKGKKLIVENLTNLKALPSEFLFVATPLKFNNADGSPVRAIGIVK